jgi:hypothetical protein
MGGPWRDRRFDATTWRTPSARVEAKVAGSPSAHDNLVGIVIGYIASVLTSIAIMLTLLHKGW